MKGAPAASRRRTSRSSRPWRSVFTGHAPSPRASARRGGHPRACVGGVHQVRLEVRPPAGLGGVRPGDRHVDPLDRGHLGDGDVVVRRQVCRAVRVEDANPCESSPYNKYKYGTDTTRHGDYETELKRVGGYALWEPRPSVA
jgi:hypothetical protein